LHGTWYDADKYDIIKSCAETNRYNYDMLYTVHNTD